MAVRATTSACTVAMVRSLLPRPKAAWKSRAGVVVTTAVPLLNQAPAGGSTATLPPPAVEALNVGRMTISTRWDCTTRVKSAL